MFNKSLSSHTGCCILDAQPQGLVLRLRDKIAPIDEGAVTLRVIQRRPECFVSVCRCRLGMSAAGHARPRGTSGSPCVRERIRIPQLA